MILDPIVAAIANAIEGISKGCTNAVVYAGNGTGNMVRPQTEKGGDMGARATDRVFEGTLQAVPKVVKSVCKVNGAIYDCALAGIKKVFTPPFMYLKGKAEYLGGKVAGEAGKGYNLVKGGAS